MVAKKSGNSFEPFIAPQFQNLGLHTFFCGCFVNRESFDGVIDIFEPGEHSIDQLFKDRFIVRKKYIYFMQFITWLMCYCGLYLILNPLAMFPETFGIIVTFRIWLSAVILASSLWLVTVGLTWIVKGWWRGLLHLFAGTVIFMSTYFAKFFLCQGCK